MTSLLLMVPSRKRRAQCERFIRSFSETSQNPDTDLLFITDGDDRETYDGMDWGPADEVVIDPRDYVAGKLNKVAVSFAGDYDAMMWLADDNVFETPGWDVILLDELRKLGGSGWVYPNDKRRTDIPEVWLCSADIVRVLGWFANPVLNHYYLADSLAYIARKTGLLRYCPDVVTPHLHYAGDPGRGALDKGKDTRDCDPYDEIYREMEQDMGPRDAAAFGEWVGTRMPHEVSLLRRNFSPEVRWILGRTQWRSSAVR